MPITRLAAKKDQWHLPEKITTRRDWGIGTVTSSIVSIFLPSSMALADVDVSSVAAEPPIEMKLFVDPKGLFSVIVPRKFFSLRRTAEGDLPDEKTGKGRRGSSIFTAGDLGKAEIIAVERYVVLDFPPVIFELFLYYSSLIFQSVSQCVFCWKKMELMPAVIF